MKNTSQLFLIILIFTHFSCDKKESNKSITLSPPVIEAPVIPITVEINEVVRTLLGDEVGINMNYLMDDAVVSDRQSSHLGDKVLNNQAGTVTNNLTLPAHAITMLICEQK